MILIKNLHIDKKFKIFYQQEIKPNSSLLGILMRMPKYIGILEALLHFRIVVYVKFSPKLVSNATEIGISKELAKLY